MLRNIEIILSNQEKLEGLIEKTEILRATTLQFKTNAMRLNKGNWLCRQFKNCRFFYCLRKQNSEEEIVHPKYKTHKTSR